MLWTIHNKVEVFTSVKYVDSILEEEIYLGNGVEGSDEALGNGSLISEWVFLETS
jgi:hypothetical protein